MTIPEVAEANLSERAKRLPNWRRKEAIPQLAEEGGRCGHRGFVAQGGLERHRQAWNCLLIGLHEHQIDISPGKGRNTLDLGRGHSQSLRLREWQIDIGQGDL